MILKKLVSELGPQHLLLLDIDSTLVHTHVRNQAIIDDFCHENEMRYPEDVAQIRRMQCQANDYGYESALSRANVEFSSTLVKGALESFWKKGFFSSDYLHHDPPTEGAKDFLKALQQKHCPFLYLTGRYEDPMLAGTKSSFDLLGFPYADSDLILKKDPLEPDHKYKSRVVLELKSSFPKITIIDNEPMILHSIMEDHPDVGVVWFESTHSGRKAPPPGVPKITSFLMDTY